ncbi:MAG: IS66 family transposase [Sediminibacterium sp.]|nr:IS66 family transposase [Sediminibacterium sp.]
MKFSNKDLLKKIDKLEKKINFLILENAELKRQLNQNSSNSHKPPSSDLFKPKPKPAFEVEDKNKKSLGGQIDHQGKNLAMVETPNKKELIAPVKCSCCGKNLKDSIINNTGTKRQVFDIPRKVNFEVTEYEIGYVECCGVKHYGSFPKNVKATTQYGNNIRGLAVYLSAENNLSMKKIISFFKTQYNLTMNVGTLCNIMHSTMSLIAPHKEQIKESLSKCKLVHLDETSINVNGKNQWVHNVSTDKFTYLYMDTSRGAKAHQSEAGYQPPIEQYIVHDCWKTYFTEYQNNPHVLCNAHIIRELKSLIENDNRKWASNMLKLLYDLYNQTKNGTIKIITKNDWIKKYKIICNQANKEEPLFTKSGRQGKTKQTRGRNLLLRLIKEQDAVLRFAFEKNIPFTNNQAERDIRPIKVKQKMATHFRSVEGAKAYLSIKSFLSTISKNGLNILDSIIAILENTNQPFNFSSA